MPSTRRRWLKPQTAASLSREGPALTAKRPAHLIYPPEALPASDEVRQELSVVICRLRAETAYGGTMSPNRFREKHPRASAGGRKCRREGCVCDELLHPVCKVVRVEPSECERQSQSATGPLGLLTKRSPPLWRASCASLLYKPGSVQLKAPEKQELRKSTRK